MGEKRDCNCKVSCPTAKCNEAGHASSPAQKNPLEQLSSTVHIVCLTKRFHVAVCLFSNTGSQMASKCGKNKKVAHEAIAECVTDVLTTF